MGKLANILPLLCLAKKSLIRMGLGMLLLEVYINFHPFKELEKFLNVLLFIGFISQLLQGRPMEICARCGIWAATQIIQQDGCSLPADLEIPDDFRPSSS
jgi:hypothetical protein